MSTYNYEDIHERIEEEEGNEMVGAQMKCLRCYRMDDRGGGRAKQYVL
jgi:hypothetical protein